MAAEWGTGSWMHRQGCVIASVLPRDQLCASARQQLDVLKIRRVPHSRSGAPLPAGRCGAPRPPPSRVALAEYCVYVRAAFVFVVAVALLWVRLSPLGR
jgi:hypothetical protein